MKIFFRTMAGNHPNYLPNQLWTVTSPDIVPSQTDFRIFHFFSFFFIEGKSVWNKTNLEWIFLEWRLFHFGFKKVTRRWSDDVWVFQTSLVLSFGHFQSFTFSLDCFYKKILSNVFHHHMLIISLFWTRIWQTRWRPTI